MPRAVLFDLDGTLLDTLQDIADSVNAVLSRERLAPHPVSAYKHYVGDGMEKLVERAFPPELVRGAGFDRILSSVRAEYSKRLDVRTRPYPGVERLLDGLAARGIPAAVFSNKPEELTVEAVKNHLGRWKFGAVIGAAAGRPMKPDPDGAFRAAEAVGVPPADFLYLGDTATDMKTATAAGMYSVGALWGFRDAEELRSAGARVLIAAPEDLLGLL
ncbi:MAG: HAD-IA family hydrolase [Elusimicrobia bacterium]|nr:HAD-IA family hydrolase [Elusimicrobiota bacterium]